MRLNKKNISIKWNIFLYLIGFCVLLLVLLWLLQTVFLNDFYKQIKLKEIQKDASLFAGFLESGDEQSACEAAMRRGDLYVELWSKTSGGVILSSNMPRDFDKQPSQFPEHEKALLFESTLENGGTFSKRTQNQSGFDKRRRESLLHTRLVTIGEESCLLIVDAIITPVDATVDTLRIQLYYVSGMMLLLAICLGLLISRQVSKPIALLSTRAKTLGKGDHVHFQTEGYKEISALSETLEQAAQALLKTDKLRQELIANVSHDLRTPLTLITGYSEMIRDLPDENTPENMQVIIDEAKRLTALVSNMLDLSRLQAGVQEMRNIEFDLTEATEKIIGRFSKFCEQEGYEISFAYTQNATILADPDCIAQVIYNFISNAITHTGPDKRIELTQTVKDGRVTLYVRDTGEGISQEQLPDIWDRYYSGNTVHKRPVVGTGLGLSIVKSILQQTPGVEYGVTSAPQAGSMFYFSIPVVD